MGYRSEVVIVVPKKYKKEMLKHIPEKNWESVTDINIDSYNNETQSTLFHLSWTKWYTSKPPYINGYSEIDNIMELLNTIDEIEGYSNYAFVRSGEDLDDAEELGEPSKYGIYINKSISF